MTLLKIYLIFLKWEHQDSIKGVMPTINTKTKYGMMNDVVRTSRHGDGKEVFVVKLCRPSKRNAVDGPTAQALVDAFVEFETDPSAKVAVLYGDQGAFCSGADLSAVSRAKDGENLKVVSVLNSDWTDEKGSRLGPMGPTRMQLSKPVIAAIAGPAVAGGLELALWCDMRVCEKSAFFGVFCRRWGVPLVDGGTVRLPRLIGQSRAMDLILTGRSVDSAEALAIGLANRVVPDGTSLEQGILLASQIAAFPQVTMLADRKSALGQWERPRLADALQFEYECGREALKQAKLGATQFAKGSGRHGAGVPGHGVQSKSKL